MLGHEPHDDELKKMSGLTLIECDLKDTAKVLEKLNSVKESLEGLDLLVNNAGAGYFGPHEELSREAL
jgi:short-subunit dehydrogenase